MRLNVLGALFWSVVFTVSLMIPMSVVADQSSRLKIFLTSCAYGTAGGAIVGLGSLAFVSNPSSSMSNVAQGASLGLYAGIAVGYYLATTDEEGSKPALPESTENSPPPSQLAAPQWALAPQWHEGKISGAEVNFFALHF